MSQTFMILLSDGLQMPSGFVADAPQRCLIYCRVPDDWVEGEAPESDGLWLAGPVLAAEKQELLLEKLYGAGWRSGNSDGSRYVVRGIGMRLLNPRKPEERPWQLDDPSNPDLRYFHYAADEMGQLQAVAPTDL